MVLFLYIDRCHHYLRRVWWRWPRLRPPKLPWVRGVVTGPPRHRSLCTCPRPCRPLHWHHPLRSTLQTRKTRQLMPLARTVWPPQWSPLPRLLPRCTDWSTTSSNEATTLTIHCCRKTWTSTGTTGNRPPWNIVADLRLRQPRRRPRLPLNWWSAITLVIEVSLFLI